MGIKPALQPPPPPPEDVSLLGVEGLSGLVFSCPCATISSLYEAVSLMLSKPGIDT